MRGLTVAPGTMCHWSYSTVTPNANAVAIGHSSKPGSACSNTEPDDSGTDFPTTALLTPPDHGSRVLPLPYCYVNRNTPLLASTSDL